MSLQRITCEDISGDALVHVCDPCEQELGRIRGVCLVDPSFDLYPIIYRIKSGSAYDNYMARVLFEAAITFGKIHLISETNGTYDGGSPQSADGFGDEDTELLGYLYTLQFKDPSYAGNKDFWQRAEREHWRVIWRTETLLHIADKPATIQATNPIESDLTSRVVWNVNVQWKSKDKPEILPLEHLKEIFEGCWESIGKGYDRSIYYNSVNKYFAPGATKKIGSDSAVETGATYQLDDYQEGGHLMTNPIAVKAGDTVTFSHENGAVRQVAIARLDAVHNYQSVTVLKYNGGSSEVSYTAEEDCLLMGTGWFDYLDALLKFRIT